MQGYHKPGQQSSNWGQPPPQNPHIQPQYHTQHSAVSGTAARGVAGNNAQHHQPPVMTHHNSWPSGYPTSSCQNQLPSYAYNSVVSNDLGMHHLQLTVPGSSQYHHHHQQQSQYHPQTSHVLEAQASPYVDPSAEQAYDAVHANYLAQIAQANQLEILLAAEAQCQHQVAVAAMQAHQRQLTHLSNQHMNVGISPSGTPIGVPTIPATSLEDIYCSSTSEASGPTSNGISGRIRNPNGSTLSLNNDSDCVSNTSTNTTTGGAGSTSTSAAGRPVAVKKYEVIRPLGVGTYGKVKLTKDVNTKQLFAVKTINLRKLLSCDSDELAGIKREIEIMSSLHHPNIIHIREVLENQEAIIIVMECAVGGELFQHLHRVKLLSESEARRLFRQTVSAIFYCHSKLIAHRDLKLENILLDEHINVKIADFGLSSPFTFDGYLTTFCGSPLYAAPEIVTGTPYHGPEIDCWSLGVILYILVYGKMPFEAPDGTNYLAELCRKIIKAEYPEPPEPSTARDLIGIMLRPNPAQRGTIQDIAHHWWMNVSYNLPVTHLPENSPANILSGAYTTNNNNTVSSSSSSSSNQNIVTSAGGAVSQLPAKSNGIKTQSMFTRPRGDAADRRGSYKRRASQKSTSVSSYTQIFPNLVSIYKAETIDFSEQVSILGNALPRLENSLRVMEPDSDIVNKRGIVKRRTKHKYEGNDSGCVLEEEEEPNASMYPRSNLLQTTQPVDMCMAPRSDGSSLRNSNHGMGSGTPTSASLSSGTSQRRQPRGIRNVTMSSSAIKNSAMETSSLPGCKTGVSGSSRRSTCAAALTTSSRSERERRGSFSSVMSALDSKQYNSSGHSLIHSGASSISSQRSVSSSRRSSFSRQKTVPPGYTGISNITNSNNNQYQLSNDVALSTIATLRRRSSLYNLDRAQSSQVNSPLMSLNSKSSRTREQSLSKNSNSSLAGSVHSSGRKSMAINRYELTNKTRSSKFTDDESDYYSSSDVPYSGREREMGISDIHERRPLSRRTSFRRAAQPPDESATDDGSHEDLRRYPGTANGAGSQPKSSSGMNRRPVNFSQSVKVRETNITSDEESTDELRHSIQRALSMATKPETKNYFSSKR